MNKQIAGYIHENLDEILESWTNQNGRREGRSFFPNYVE